MLLLVVVVAVLQFSSTGAEKACGILKEDDVYNVTVTTAPYEYPWIAKIFTKETESQDKYLICNGVLVHKRYVITSAYCVYMEPGSVEFTVPNSLGDSSQVYDIVEVTKHPKYTPRPWANDLALLRLSHDVPVNDQIQPICLPPANFDDGLLMTKLLHVAGISLFGENEKFKSFVMPTNPHYCQKRYKNLDFSFKYSHVICGLANPPVRVREGMPLMAFSFDQRGKPQSAYIVGLVSFWVARNSSFPGVFPDGYISIMAHMEWINDTLSN